jgi:hypothetical protein
MNYLYLTRPKGQLLALSFLSKDVDLIDKFKHLGWQIPKSAHWFHQGDSAHWQMFEFWCDKDSEILDIAIEISNKMEMELELEDPSVEWIRKFA